MRAGGRGVPAFLAKTDWITLLLCFAASVFGLLLVHSATLRTAQAAEMPVSRDVIVMAAATVLGAAIAIAASFLDYELILRFWYVFAGVCLLMMMLLFTPLRAAPAGRADSAVWIKLPVAGGIFFQPSELLKVGFIISFTWHLHLVRNNINKLKAMVMLAVHAGLPFALVVRTGDLGSALVFLCITAGMLFLAGLRLRWFAAMLALAAAAMPAVWIYFINSFQKQRIYAVYAPQMLTEEQLKAVLYQQRQARYAMGSGQLLGEGLFKGSYIQSGSVPESQNDMIFSVAGEELGFVGALGVLLLLAVIVIRLVRVSGRTRNTRARLLCSGVALMIGAQVVINIGMCIQLLPVIGITLPFFSAGGSSNLCVYIGIGLVLTAYRHQNEHEDTESYFDYLYT
jgi:rod shape determining protein RodA